MKKIRTRLLSILLAAVMVLTMVPMTVMAEEEHSFTDTADHWAESAIDRWSGYEVVNGNGDGTFAPDANLTRAEMAQIYVNLLHLTEKADISKFTDIPQDAWYADAVARCVAAGILNGTGENTISPLDAVTREQMFVTFGRAVGMSPADTTDSGLNDLDEMSDWSEGMINALLNAGYISGMGDNTLQPLSDINRASVVSLLDKTIGGYGNKSGVMLDMTGEDKLVLIVSGDVTVTGQTGDIIILQGAAEGTVKLEDADISGKVTLSAPGAKLEITGNTSASDIVVGTEAKGAEVTVAKDAVVDNLTTSADNTAVSVSGKIENVNVESGASDITVNAEKGATVGKVTTSGKNTAVSGNGTVTDVEASEGSSGTKVETEGTKIENNSDSDVTTGAGSAVKPGETGTTAGNSGSGGSTGGSGGSSHSHRYTDGVCSCGAYDPSWAQVNSAETWNQAVSEGKNIVVTADFTADSQLQISNPVIVNGNGKTITAGSWDDANISSKGDASLVLINHVSGSIVLENITLTGAKTIDSTASGGQKDYGHGLNIYESGDVTLKNVTLRDNAGAGMVVNSSGVNAEGLHTSGNAWGGVNIDKNSGESAPDASLTFDASSVFEEAAAIYSDNGGVTVTYPAGWSKVNTESGKAIWIKAFAGGTGTEADPYEIETPSQLYNVGLFSEINNHYKLLNDIDMTSTEASKEDAYGDSGDIYQLYGELDGNGYKIISHKDTAGTILYAKNALIKNITFDVKEHPAVTNATNTEFADVTVTGQIEVGNNNGAFVTYAEPVNGEVSLYFNNCTADVEMTGEGAANNYNAVFVGYAYGGGNKTNLSFTNCTNEGNLVCGKAAMFLGNNSANQGIVKITVDECANNGEIRSTYIDSDYGWNHFVATGANANNTIILDGEELTSATEGKVTSNEPGGFFQGPEDEELELTENEDGTFTISPSDNSSVSYYVVTMSLYASLLNADGEPEGGTMVVRVSDRVNAGDQTLQTTMKHLSFVDEDWVAANGESSEIKEEGSGEYMRTMYTCAGQSYYYFGSEADTMATLNGTPKAPQSVSVSAYDADGNLLSSKALTK